MNEKGKRWIDPTDNREIVPHGFRSSFRDWCAESGVADAVAESCLAHVVSDKVVKAYRRTKFDELRRQTMSDWAAYVERADDEKGVVVAFKKQ